METCNGDEMITHMPDLVTPILLTRIPPGPLSTPPICATDSNRPNCVWLMCRLPMIFVLQDENELSKKYEPGANRHVRNWMKMRLHALRGSQRYFSQPCRTMLGRLFVLVMRVGDWRNGPVC